MEPYGGCLCIGCLEKRIGRKLKPKDFPDHPLTIRIRPAPSGCGTAEVADGMSGSRKYTLQFRRDIVEYQVRYSATVRTGAMYSERRANWSDVGLMSRFALGRCGHRTACPGEARRAPGDSVLGPQAPTPGRSHRHVRHRKIHAGFRRCVVVLGSAGGRFSGGRNRPPDLRHRNGAVARRRLSPSIGTCGEILLAVQSETAPFRGRLLCLCLAARRQQSSRKGATEAPCNITRMASTRSLIK